MADPTTARKSGKAIKPPARFQRRHHGRGKDPAESFFGRLKTEWSSRNRYRTREEAKRSIYFYIEMFYHSKRRHATLGYVSPNDFEDQPLTPAA